MLSRRLLYCAALAAALLFQITNDSYLAHFLLGLCVALPLLSLAMSLPGMTSCRVTLAAGCPRPARGGKTDWTLTLDAPSALPLARMTIRLRERNLFTGEEKRRTLTLSGVARRRPIVRAADTSHCGLVEMTAGRVRVLDYLGLFALRRSDPAAARLLCMPVPEDPGPLNLPESAGARPAPVNAARRGPGEDFDLRGYRPGDPIRSIHWKLSSKWDELIVRERFESLLPLPLLTLDRFGAPEELDRVLDKLLGYSRALLAVQRPHGVLWLDESGQPRFCPVSDEKELTDCLLELTSAPLPPSGPALDGRPELLAAAGEAVLPIRLTPGEEAGHG